MMKQYLLFDLDGTLTDPKVGITTCVQYALQSFGIEEPDLNKLEPFIGPPLKDSFMQFYDMSEEQAEATVAKYRERFQDIGLFENEVYAGIPQMLHTLQSKGIFLAVASSKPTVYVERILEHFKLRKYFKVVVGSELDGTRVNKDEVVHEALAQLFGNYPIRKEKVYMIGDRKFDVEGARALHIESVGVTYGYGSEEELKEAKATHIVHSVEELQSFLLRGTEQRSVQQEAPQKRFNRQHIWPMLYAFFLFIMVRSVAMYAFNMLLAFAGQNMSGALADFLLIRDEAGVLTGFTGNAATLMSALSFICGALPVISMAKRPIVKTQEDLQQSCKKNRSVMDFILWGVATITSVIGINILFELLQFTTKSDTYRQVVEDQYAANFVIGILCYILVTPIAEELVFRGVIYNYLRRLTKLRTAVLVGALVFGFYHMNAVQGVYGFLMGILIIYSYEYFGSFKAPVGVHMICNAISYCLSYTSLVVNGFVSWPVCIICLAFAGAALWQLNKQKAVM